MFLRSGVLYVVFFVCRGRPLLFRENTPQQTEFKGIEKIKEATYLTFTPKQRALVTAFRVKRAAKSSYQKLRAARKLPHTTPDKLPEAKVTRCVDAYQSDVEEELMLQQAEADNSDEAEVEEEEAAAGGGPRPLPLARVRGTTDVGSLVGFRG